MEENKCSVYTSLYSSASLLTLNTPRINIIEDNYLPWEISWVFFPLKHKQ